MGTGGYCLCLLGYKALKWPVSALCSGWPQNPHDLLVVTGRCHRLLWERPRPSFQPHKCRQNIWGNLANQWSLGTSTLRVNTYSGLVWIRVFSGISWKSLFYHWERWWRSGQSGQLACRIRHEFVFTLHSVGISCESPDRWYTSIFHLCSCTKTLDSHKNLMDILPYNIISHLKTDVPKNTQHYMIHLRFPFLWTHF